MRGEYRFWEDGTKALSIAGTATVLDVAGITKYVYIVIIHQEVHRIKCTIVMYNLIKRFKNLIA